MTNEYRDNRYSNNCYSNDFSKSEIKIDGECFRYGKPLNELSNLELKSIYTRAWNLSDCQQLEEIKSEFSNRNLNIF